MKTTKGDLDQRIGKINDGALGVFEDDLQILSIGTGESPNKLAWSVDRDAQGRSKLGRAILLLKPDILSNRALEKRILAGIWHAVSAELAGWTSKLLRGEGSQGDGNKQDRNEKEGSHILPSKVKSCDSNEPERSSMTRGSQARDDHEDALVQLKREENIQYSKIREGRSQIE